MYLERLPTRFICISCRTLLTSCTLSVVTGLPTDCYVDKIRLEPPASSSEGTMFKFSMVTSPVLWASKVPSDLNIEDLNLDALKPSFSPVLTASTAPVDEPTAMSSTIPLTGSIIVATAAVEATYSASADCTDSAIPTCSGDVCVTMSCGGGSFTPDGAYDSLWDHVRPMCDGPGQLSQQVGSAEGRCVRGVSWSDVTTVPKRKSHRGLDLDLSLNAEVNIWKGWKENGGTK